MVLLMLFITCSHDTNPAKFPNADFDHQNIAELRVTRWLRIQPLTVNADMHMFINICFPFENGSLCLLNKSFKDACTLLVT